MNFLSKEAGQARRSWLDNMSASFADSANYYLGPAAEPLNAIMSLGQYSDAGDVQELGNASRELWNNPSLTNALRMATATGAAAIPIVSAKMMADGVDVFSDAARSFGEDARGFAADEYGGPGRNLTPAQQQSQDVLDLLSTGRASEVTDDMLAAADDMYLFDNYDLPMDEASRLARLDAILPDEQFHATNADFPAFEPSQTGLAGRGVYSGDYADEVEDYAVGRGSEGSLMMPIRVPSSENYASKIEWEDSLPSSVYNMEIADVPTAFKNTADEMTSLGFAGVTSGPGQRVTFDPANIRSRFARGDPRLSQLRNLSAGVGAGMLIGGQVGNDDQELINYLRGGS